MSNWNDYEIDKKRKEIARTQRKEIGKWLNRLRFKSDWKQQDRDEMTYSEFQTRVFYLVNTIRPLVGFEKMTQKQLDEGWQLLTVNQNRYDWSYDHMIKFVYFDW